MAASLFVGEQYGPRETFRLIFRSTSF